MDDWEIHAYSVQDSDRAIAAPKQFSGFRTLPTGPSPCLRIFVGSGAFAANDSCRQAHACSSGTKLADGQVCPARWPRPNRLGQRLRCIASICLERQGSYFKRGCCRRDPTYPHSAARAVRLDRPDCQNCRFCPGRSCFHCGRNRPRPTSCLRAVDQVTLSYR